MGGNSVVPAKAGTQEGRGAWTCQFRRSREGGNPGGAWGVGGNLRRSLEGGNPEGRGARAALTSLQRRSGMRGGGRGRLMRKDRTCRIQSPQHTAAVP